MLTWFALGFLFYLPWLAGTASRESWANSSKKKRKDMFTVWWLFLPKGTWNYPFSANSREMGAAGIAMSSALTSQRGKWPLCVWRQCVPVSISHWMDGEERAPGTGGHSRVHPCSCLSSRHRCLPPLWFHWGSKGNKTAKWVSGFPFLFPAGTGVRTGHVKDIKVFLAWVKKGKL